ncbi:MAG: AAA family ATPase [Oscillospiraceae bacterium]|jgi:5-methylcytosine-specific restriction endonuclease McrBC GTP-binding regulatory subunit McrB|nr:AAA family ATPase [Oscillospiraceae bacterium]
MEESNGDAFTAHAENPLPPNPEGEARRYWVYAPGVNSSWWEEVYAEGTMRLPCGKTGSIAGKSIEEIIALLKGKWISDKPRDVMICMYDLANNVRPGDIIYVRYGSKKILGRGVVTGAYTFDDNPDSPYISEGSKDAAHDMRHCRTVQWTHKVEWDYIEPTDKQTGKPIKLKKQFLQKVTETDHLPILRSLFGEEPDYNPQDQGETTMTADYDINTILYGPPGTGKTYATILYAVGIIEGKSLEQIKAETATDGGYAEAAKRFRDYKEKGQVQFTTFHQSYCYEEFIEGIRPDVSCQEGAVRYELRDGLFKAFCKKAQSAVPESGADGSAESAAPPPYVFIIDEINRGNISDIFGELITLIESTKRLGKDEEQTCILPYSREAFGVPKNVYLIGTMNTADRSIMRIDTALRRRFTFKEMLTDYSLLDFTVAGIHIGSLVSTINARIEALYDREHTIGHSFFLGDCKRRRTLPALGKVFADNIIPLLQEYFFEDYMKIWQVLGGAFVEELPDVPGLESPDDRVRGRIDLSGKDKKETYLAIQRGAYGYDEEDEDEDEDGAADDEDEA